MISFIDSIPFSVYAVAALSSKAVHLFQHVDSVPTGELILYFPTLLIPDVFFISLQRVLLRRERNILSTIAYCLGVVITFMTFGAASSELGFYYETGGSIDWREAGNFAGDEEGMKVLLDGTLSVAISGLFILISAWFLRNLLYRVTGELMTSLGRYVLTGLRYLVKTLGVSRTPLPKVATPFSDESGSRAETESWDDDSIDAHEGQRFLEEGHEKLLNQASSSTSAKTSCTLTSAALLWLLITSIIRPRTPYNHMSTTLPFPLVDVMQAAPDPCGEALLLSQNQWPLTNSTGKEHWVLPKGNFKGWTPGHDTKAARAYRDYSPTWLPEPAPKGFERWEPEQDRFAEFVATPPEDGHNENVADPATECAANFTDNNFYNPVLDPMRITNLDTDILQPVKDAFADGVKIKHVAFVLMESMRHEVFPLKQNSTFTSRITDSHIDEEKDEINKLLSQLTPNAEKITGLKGDFHNQDGQTYKKARSQWKSAESEDYGGINVLGSLTPSGVSTKSVVALHCGAYPLAVDHLPEAHLEPYQPCMPQVLDLFNLLKNKTEEKAAQDNVYDFLESEWAPMYFQSTTDNYDGQDIFGRRIGLTEKVTKKQLAAGRLFDKQKLEQVNYFGYPEKTLKPYMQEYINQTLAANKRMFLSHFTSTMHHTWGVPSDFDKKQYFKADTGSKEHKDLNKYLNTVKYVDSWLGEMMQMLDDYGVANETLVVFVGDHGQSFQEDTKKKGTYLNGHISNYRVPISFYHPHLPRVQYEANATSISILPTVLDLLINTNSLNAKDRTVAEDIIQDYEGQSLIRPYKTHDGERRAWNFGIVNSGGGMLTITSADAPWRLVMPLEVESAYRFTDLSTDPLELKPTENWTVEGILKVVQAKFGDEAAKWTEEAEQVARWWVLEHKKLWGYSKR